MYGAWEEGARESIPADDFDELRMAVKKWRICAERKGKYYRKLEVKKTKVA